MAGPLHLVAFVLVISGAQKLVAPRPATDAMRSAGLRVPVAGGVVLGAVEASTGIAALAVPSSIAAGWLGVFYLSLAVFVVVLRRRDATAGCGCFGASSAPPTALHAALNVVSAGIGFGAAIAGPADIVDVVDSAGVAVPYLVLLTTGAALVLVGPGLLATIDQTVRGSVPRRFGLR